jgi:hypothetical protein
LTIVADAPTALRCVAGQSCILRDNKRCDLRNRIVLNYWLMQVTGAVAGHRALGGCIRDTKGSRFSLHKVRHGQCAGAGVVECGGFDWLKACAATVPGNWLETCLRALQAYTVNSIILCLTCLRALTYIVHCKAEEK